MKKFSLMLAALMLLSLTACGEEAKESVASDTAADTEVVTEAATTEAVTTAPVTTEVVTEAKPQYVEVYTPVAEYTFDDAADKTWSKGGTASAFVVENGIATLTANGGDSNITSKKLSLPCESINAIRVRFRNCTDNDTFQIFFTTDTTSSFCEEASYKDVTEFMSSDADADEWNEMIIYTEENDLWTGTLYSLRIDLTNGEGDMMVDSISLDTVTLEEVTE